MLQSGRPTGCPFFLEFYVDLNLVHIVFEVTTDNPPALLPQLYDTVRRFDGYFKSINCSQADLSCQLCREQSALCAYRSVFGQFLSVDPDILRRHQKPPLPFAFRIRENAYTSSCIELGIVIVGNAIQHMSMFQRAINLMVASVASNSGMDVAVSGTWSVDYQGGRHEFNAPSHSLTLLSGPEIIESTQYSDVVRICFDSPLRLISAGSIVHSFDFALLLRSQLRRCSSLFAYYGEGELELDYVYMSDAAKRVTCIENSFRFTKPQWTQRAGLAGMLGSGEFTDLTDGMLPLLMLGSYLNAGKGAAFGMGVYRLEEM